MSEQLNYEDVINTINTINFNDISSKTTGNYKDDFEAFNKKRFSDQFFNFRESIKGNLVILLYFEIFMLSGTLLLQGFGLFGFNLNDWAFGFFINGCLVQTFFLIKYIVKHLFPEANIKTNNT